MEHYLKTLIGDENNFTLEERTFHAVCISLVISLAICIPVVIFLHIPQLAILLTVVVLMGFAMYYLSRFKKLYRVMAALFQILIYIALIGNYYYNSGAEGPTYAIFLLAFLVSVVTCPTKQYYIWLPVNVLLIIGLLTVEFMIPESIHSTYKNDISRYTDLAYSYIIIATFAFLITLFVRKTYNKQRAALEAQSEELRAANAIRNKLLSILSHDLKEPLNSLQGYLQVLTDFELDEDEKKEMEGQLLNMTKNTSLMLSNILLWANGQSHHFRADIKSLVLINALCPVWELTKSIGSSKKITMHLEVPADAMVLADPQMLELVVRNLLMNAIKFTPQGKNIWLSASEDMGRCIISIRDEGVGIPLELQKNIFSLGVKPGVGTELEKGTGLGLVLCKEFIELMNGSISFESTLNEGTTFYIALPIPLEKSKVDSTLKEEGYTMSHA